MPPEGRRSSDALYEVLLNMVYRVAYFQTGAWGEGDIQENEGIVSNTRI